jgi:hypothetical protein
MEVKIPTPPEAKPDTAARIQRTAETLADAAKKAGAPPAQAVQSAQELATEAHGITSPAKTED